MDGVVSLLHLHAFMTWTGTNLPISHSTSKDLIISAQMCEYSKKKYIYSRLLYLSYI